MSAKKELKNTLKNVAEILCAKIEFDKDWNDKVQKTIKLSCNYSKEQLEQFYKELDFDYDSGYGGQMLFGIVWLKDGTWLSRGEYDGSEWWEHNKLPSIPKELL